MSDIVERLINAAAELVEVANLRGDNELPSPPYDHILWFARMQSAWVEIEAALDADPAAEIARLRKQLDAERAEVDAEPSELVVACRLAHAAILRGKGLTEAAQACERALVNAAKEHTIRALDQKEQSP